MRWFDSTWWNKTDGAATRGTNPAEAEFILERLLEFADQESPPTVGIITPFREQQTLTDKEVVESRPRPGL